MLVFFWIIRGSVDFQLLANRPLKKKVICALLHARCYFFALVAWFIEYILFRSHWLEVNHNFLTYQAPYLFPVYENFCYFLVCMKCSRCLTIQGRLRNFPFHNNIIWPTNVE